MSLKGSDTPYEESNYYSILNLFYFVKAKFLPVFLDYAGFRYKGFVEEIQNDFIRVIIEDFQETPERRAVLSFEALNRYYQASLLILRSNEQGVFLPFPEKIYYYARRRHVRLRFDDLFMRFIILYSPILQNRAEEKYMEARYSEFLSEVLQDEPSLKVVYQMFVREIQKISRNFEIKILQGREEKELSLFERLLLKTGKTIFIEDVARLGSYIDKIPSNRVINLHSYYEELVSQMGEYRAILQMEKIKKEDLQEFLVSYMMVPFTLFDNILGYVRLETNQFDKYFLALSQAEELSMVADLFSYGITKIRIRRSHFDVSSVQTRVVNISLSGLLMEFSDAVLYRYLQKNRRIKMLIPLEDRELEISGEIVRYFEKDNLYYAGVLFFKSRPDDLYHLERYIYENLHYQFY
ncbi:MAG: DUF1577 domain-containing protein [Leptospiraceae bacterium]|nr:DUF1577 domain-containing protein [Leptospiraceae bacterium]MDW8306955.1 DUF1577 domain-containing protein [Leptospiraceae bacterium]